MNIDQIRYFISAADIRNFTLAALENDISQSSFSKQIINLEGELGTALFSREKKVIELTSAGEQFYPYAAKMLGLYGDMLRMMENYSEQRKLPVSICSIPVLQSYNMIELIIELQKTFSNIVFSVSEVAESSDVLRTLHKGMCDFAVLRTDFLEPEKYNMFPFIKDHLAVVLSKDNPLARKEVCALSLLELQNESFIMPPEKTDLRTISFNACIKSGFRPSIAFITSGNLELSMDLVEKRNGVYLGFEKVIMPSVRNRNGSVVCRPLAEVIESYTALVSLKSKPETPILRRISDFLRNKSLHDKDELMADRYGGRT